MGTLVLLRHGESEWNTKGLFTGWVDVGLAPKGAQEAAAAGRMVVDAGLRPDVVHTSVLTRAIQTANVALDAAGLSWLPVQRSWRLNERHYGALCRARTKAQTREEFGDEQFMIWRRSYDVPPPPIPDDDPSCPQAGDPQVRDAAARADAADRMPSAMSVADAAILVRRDRAGPQCMRPDGPGGGPRQLAARAGQSTIRTGSATRRSPS